MTRPAWQRVLGGSEGSSQGRPPARDLAGRFLPGALVVAAGAAAARWGWRRSTDPLIDFGRELYVPWRLLEGDVLHRDIAHLNGPLSQYLNSLWFRLFGVGLETLLWCNLVLTALIGVLLFRLLLAVAGRWGAAAGGLAFTTVFAFNAIEPNLNYLTPYAHEIVHGLLLGLLSIACLRWRPLGAFAFPASGLLLGLCFLTKPEVFLASTAGAVACLFLTLVEARLPAAEARRQLLAFAGGCLIGPALSFLLLSLAMPAGDALRGTLGGWWLVPSGVGALPYYRLVLGTADLAASLREMASWLLVWLVWLVPAVLVALRIRRGLVGAALSCLAGLAVAVLAADELAAVVRPPERAPYLDAPLLWWDAVRPLPLALAALLALRGREAARALRERREAGQAILSTALLAFALVLLAKTALNTRLIHYGFVLAMPGTLLVVAALASWLPAAVAARGGHAGLVRTISLLGVALVAASQLANASWALSKRTVPVGEGVDAFYTDRRGAAVAPTLDLIARKLAPGERFAVLPEGVMLNYLARRPTPSPHVNFMPPELHVFGEREILASFRRDPPEWMVRTHRRTPEYGVGDFGRGFGRELAAWLHREYRPVQRVGDPGTGFKLLRRRAVDFEKRTRR